MARPSIFQSLDAPVQVRYDASQSRRLILQTSRGWVFSACSEPMSENYRLQWSLESRSGDSVQVYMDPENKSTIHWRVRHPASGLWFRPHRPPLMLRKKRVGEVIFEPYAPTSARFVRAMGDREERLRLQESGSLQEIPQHLKLLMHPRLMVGVHGNNPRAGEARAYILNAPEDSAQGVLVEDVLGRRWYLYAL